ncbi:hypothetical protein F2Q69_00013552 [Brassica cretica]|uniref:Uncharacterized protein n=1 Tax=Brassica cretica TaxID=69181 RepID=A0A8S9QST9_BRACR|nr:hypothetical protein F2Q69_00013552 [Brassica cretica]
MIMDQPNKEDNESMDDPADGGALAISEGRSHQGGSQQASMVTVGSHPGAPLEEDAGQQKSSLLGTAHGRKRLRLEAGDIVTKVVLKTPVNNIGSKKELPNLNQRPPWLLSFELKKEVLDGLPHSHLSLKERRSCTERLDRRADWSEM